MSYLKRGAVPVLSHSSPLLLASASPRRRELLETVGLPLVVRRIDADEDVLPGESPAVYLARVVAAKRDAALAIDPGPCAARLVADTTVVLGGEILGKPRDYEEAKSMVARLAGRTHEVMTRFWVGPVDAPDVAIAKTVVTHVEVRSLPVAWIERYAATGEGADKAGGYAVQGVFSFAVTRIDGSYANVVGLPVAEVVAALDELGLVPDFLLRQAAPKAP